MPIALPTLGLPKSVRKLIGTVATITFILLYIFFAASLGNLVVTKHWAIQTIFFLVLGLLWIFPVMAIIRWMERPDAGDAQEGPGPASG